MTKSPFSFDYLSATDWRNLFTFQWNTWGQAFRDNPGSFVAIVIGFVILAVLLRTMHKQHASNKRRQGLYESVPDYSVRRDHGRIDVDSTKRVRVRGNAEYHSVDFTPILEYSDL